MWNLNKICEIVYGYTENLTYGHAQDRRRYVADSRNCQASLAQVITIEFQQNQ
jgi:hypothetical protein